MSDEVIKPPTTTSDNSLARALNYVGNKIRVQFDGDCLKQDKITYTHGTIVNTYIIYELISPLKYFDLTLENCLFGAVKSTKNADIDKYKNSGYGIGFDGQGAFSFPSGGLGCNVTISGVDMSSSVLVDNKKKYILILREGPMQGLDGTTLTAEKMYSINFTKSKKKFCLSLHYNGANSYLFVNGTEIIKFKAKDSEITATPLSPRNISKDFSACNMKKTGLYRYAYDFSVDYDAIAVDDTRHSQVFNEKEWDSIKCLDLFLKIFVVAMTFFGCNAIKSVK